MKIDKLIQETYKIQQEAKKLNEQVQANKQKIQAYFDDNEVLSKEDNKTIVAGNVKATKITSAYMTYNGFQLEKKLKKHDKKNLIGKIIRKTYTVVDMKALTNLIRLTSISPYEFKGHFHVERQVDTNTVKRLFETGDLTIEDLQGCFESKLVDSIRLSEIKTSEGD